MTTTDRFLDVPVNRFLGLRLRSHDEEVAEASLPVRQEFVQEEGCVHGGIVTILADTTAVYLFHPRLAGGQGMTSIEFKMNFLRPVLVDGGDLVARAKLVRRGRRVGVCRVDVEQDGRAVAFGVFTYMFLERE